jgi:protein TonB
MAPSAIVEHGILEKALEPKHVEILPLDQRVAQPEIVRPIKPAVEFAKAVLIEQNPLRTGSRALDVAISVVMHIIVIGTPILLGLFFTDTINIKQYASMMLVAPPPPPPPPPPAAAVVRPAPVHRVFTSGGKLLAPTVIPKEIALLKETPLAPDSFGGVEGGVPGGVPGGSMGGVVGGVIGGVLGSAVRPPLPAAKPTAPIRVGGRVKPPKPIVQVHPEYPLLAKQARIQGQVLIDAILDEQGNVVEMRVVSGPPLLHQAALDALKQWKYEPVYLNDQPIAVEMIVTINFQLSQ